jgi:hypothetical protein
MVKNLIGLVVWVDKEGILRGVGPFTPENKIVHLQINEDDTVVRVKAIIKMIYRYRKIDWRKNGY